MVLRVVTYPAMGKDAELRALLEEGLAPMYRSRGVGVNVMNRIFVEDGPEYALYVGFGGNLEDYEKFRETNAADPEWRNLVSQIGQLQRKPTSRTFFIPMMDLPGSPVRPEANYYHRVVMRPNPGYGNELVEALTEYIHQRHSEGRTGARLTRQALPTKGPTFVIVDSYETLAELDNDILRQRPESISTLQPKLKGLLQSQVEHETYEIISKS